MDRKVDLENLLNELEDKSDMTHRSGFRLDHSDMNSIKIGPNSSRNQSRGKTKVSNKDSTALGCINSNCIFKRFVI